MAIVFSVFLILLVLGMPLAFSIGIAGVFYFLQHPNLPMSIMVQLPITQTQNFALLAVPLFILAGNLLNRGGTTHRLAKFAMIITGRMRGGFAQTSVVLSTMMGGVSGSCIADAAMEARLLGPDMIKSGYSKGFAACNIAFTGLITATIPPGNALIIFGTASNVSIGKLFAGGLVIGLFMMVVMMFTTWFISYRRGYKPARTEKLPKRMLWESFKECFWALLFPFILLFGIKMGLFTPSEVGAFACVYAFCVGRFAYKELNKENFILALKDSVADIGAVMFIIAFSAILGYGVPIDRVPQAVTGFIVGISTNPTVILLLLVALLVFIGMFMEGAATILILTPVFMPMIQSLGIDPVLFGLIFCTVVTLGNCTPPVGLSMFTVNSILDCSLQEYCKEMVIWLITFLLSVVIIILVPGPFMYLQEAFF